MNILLFGRIGSRDVKRGGGISRSAFSIKECLSTIGDSVILLDIKAELIDIPKNIDIVWMYGDFDTIPNKITKLRSIYPKIPIIINSTWDNSRSRAKWMSTFINELPANNNIFWAVFTRESIDNPMLRPIKDKIVVVPKVLRMRNTINNTPFESRSGICIGEIAKVLRRNLTKVDIVEWLDKLHANLPDIDLWSYSQYSTNSELPKYVKIKSYQQDEFVNWLGSFRLFVSLVNHETFAMVPMEAQFAGTPVFYRNMPQSLSSYINHTGYVYDDIDDLVWSIKEIYYDKEKWSFMSSLSQANSKTKTMHLQAPILHLLLNKVIQKCKN